MAQNIENQFHTEQSERFKPAVDLVDRVEHNETANFIIPETPAERAEKIDSARQDVLEAIEATRGETSKEIAITDIPHTERATYTDKQMAARGLKRTDFSPEQATLEFVQQRGSILDNEPPREKATRLFQSLPFIYPFVSKNAT